MDNLVIDATKSTPQIRFDAGNNLLRMEGESYPENAAKFYSPVFDWLKDYLVCDSADNIVVDLCIVYLNSSSSKVFLNFFEMLEQAAKSGKNITVNWRYHPENETAQECGEEFMEDLSDLRFNLLELDEESAA